ncbi:Defensin-like Protein [Tribolium castaneum]|uniref:Defensin-like Protein n=1 Tax=Tribolium castaneum TaxID=7070 RepID=D6WDY8_TRICA|nr:PREDICTED: tenecin-1 [Tribolium castaneum]EFA01376.2 Defensin-like Protein [Tribolium castaneum]|eukprot:XP_968237.2 PREDICTED: tenecin-1 [Tribolium castaneum]
MITRLDNELRVTTPLSLIYFILEFITVRKIHQISITNNTNNAKMKLLIVALVALFCIFETTAFPTDGEHIRVKRFTCDVLSAEGSFRGVSVKLNHSACATHCLFLKKRGGYCNNKAICVCRN